MAKEKFKIILTTKEVAEFLAMHPLTINRYARQGKIPAFKVGGDWRFHRKYIERWIQDKVDWHFKPRESNTGIN